jgi:hypothetical protein
MRWLRRLVRGDGATSPVIGVIMMVGTTVVMSSAVFGWTSAFTNVPEQGVHLLGLVGNEPAEGNVKRYTVAAVMPGLRYADVALTLDGEVLAMAREKGCPAPGPGEYVVCLGDETLAPRDATTAGDTVVVHAMAGQVLRVVDHASGSVVLVLAVT